ncbi:MAG TPA: hypothetical protein VFE24_03870 [Pirellulales bacterium]|nr:hypothetical protein [Pirellulales bacterium]
MRHMGTGQIERDLNDLRDWSGCAAAAARSNRAAGAAREPIRVRLTAVLDGLAKSARTDSPRAAGIC